MDLGLRVEAHRRLEEDFRALRLVLSVHRTLRDCIGASRTRMVLLPLALCLHNGKDARALRRQGFLSRTLEVYFCESNDRTNYMCLQGNPKLGPPSIALWSLIKGCCKQNSSPKRRNLQAPSQALLQDAPLPESQGPATRSQIANP